MEHGGILPEVYIAYETWGTLNADRSNAILLHTGLSASSHAKSTSKNPKPGWWEHVIGPGKPLDTNHYFVICTNPIGGCFGSSGPSSLHPQTEKPYATTFPIITIFDMVRAQFRLLDYLGIEKLFASVGNSMGGMQALAAGVIGGADRIGKIITVSAAARSFPSSIAMRFVQRQGPTHPSNSNGSVDGGPPLEPRGILQLGPSPCRNETCPRNSHNNIPLRSGMGCPLRTNTSVTFIPTCLLRRLPN